MATEPTPAAIPAVAPGSTSVPGGPPITPELLAGDGQESLSLEEAKKLRKEAQALRTRLSGYESAEKLAQEAALSDLDKANKLRVDAETKVALYRKQVVTAKVQMAAQAKGIIDPELAAMAIEGKLEDGDDGMPTNIDKLLDELIKNKPYLLANPGTTTPATPAQTNNHTPALPAMNPGRSSIQQPGSLPPGKRHKLSDLF
jgi:hypothetical protein